ncbi:hypothetical protein ES705_32979 [subsurface metagenome]
MSLPVCCSIVSSTSSLSSFSFFISFVSNIRSSSDSSSSPRFIMDTGLSFFVWKRSQFISSSFAGVGFLIQSSDFLKEKSTKAITATKSKKPVPVFPMKAFSHSLNKKPWLPPKPLPRYPPVSLKRNPRQTEISMTLKIVTFIVFQTEKSFRFNNLNPIMISRKGNKNDTIPNHLLKKRKAK